jgi:diphthine synthase
MLSLVGLGLGDERDITVRGLETVKKADTVFLESYTAILSDASRLEAAFGKPCVVADREMVESGAVLDDCRKGKHVALLVVGDPFGATTHSDLVVRCHEEGFKVDVVHNASILNAVGCCGLQLYRFGQVLSLCFWTETWRPTSWFERLVENRRIGVHTLLLLDIKVKEVSDENLARGRRIFEPARFMTIQQAVHQVLAVEAERNTGTLGPRTIACGVARVGAADQQIVVAPLEELAKVDFGGPLHSLAIAGDIHECETDHLLLLVGRDAATGAPVCTKEDLLLNNAIKVTPIE